MMPVTMPMLSYTRYEVKTDMMQEDMDISLTTSSSSDHSWLESKSEDQCQAGYHTRCWLVTFGTTKISENLRELRDEADHDGVGGLRTGALAVFAGGLVEHLRRAAIYV